MTTSVRCVLPQAKGTGGSRAYLAVAGGLDTPAYLGSRSTFPGGALGGVQGRALRPGDLIPLGEVPDGAGVKEGVSVPPEWRPAFAGKAEPWRIGVLPGPNAAPDYFQDEDIKDFYSSTYTVHYNSCVPGVCLCFGWEMLALPFFGLLRLLCNNSRFYTAKKKLLPTHHGHVPAYNAACYVKASMQTQARNGGVAVLQEPAGGAHAGPQAQVGPQGRRRGRLPPLQRTRPPVRDRHHQLHGRHAHRPHV